MGNLESKVNKAKLELAAIDQLKADLATTEWARDTSYAALTQAKSEVATTGAQRNKSLLDLIELQAVAYGPVY